MKNFLSRKNFLLHLMAVMVVTILLGVGVYQACLETLKGTLKFNLQSAVDQGAFTLDSYLETQLELLQTLASSPELRASPLVVPPDWISHFKASTVLKRINYIDISGNGITVENKKFWVGDRDYFLQALGGKRVIEGPIMSRIDSTWVCVAAVPILAADGKVQAVLSASYDASTIRNVLLSIKGQAPGDSWLLNKGDILISHTRSFVFPTGSSFLSGWYADQKNYWLKPSDAQGVSEEGGFIIAHKQLAQTGWVLWRSVSTEEFLAPIRTILFALGALLVLGLIGITILVVVRYRGELRLEEMKQERERAIKEAYGHIRNLAYYDTVTRLPNRHLILRKLGEKMRDKENAELYLVSLARFRSLNSTFGLSFGDTLLKEATQRLQQLWKEEGEPFLGRLGGNEFLVLLEPPPFDQGAPNMRQLELRGEALVQAFASPMGQGDLRVNVGVHVGACYLQSAGTTPEEVLKSAETALFEARRKEISGLSLFTEEGARRAHRRTRLEQLLPEALDRGELEVYYQAQFDLREQRIIGYEALARWTSPVFGSVSPVEFIPLAEESGFILKLGLWVLKQSISFCRTVNTDSRYPIVVSVNVSPIQLLHPNFFDAVGDILMESGLAPSLLGLEITESSLMEAFETVNPSIHVLMERGIKFSLDDFGTGYSSLNYLKNLPLNVVKLDKSFIDGLATDQRMGKMVQSIIELAHHLGLKVVAEGIETDAQKAFIQDCGCDYIQGFLVSKPLPPGQITEEKGSGR